MAAGNIWFLAKVRQTQYWDGKSSLLLSFHWFCASPCVLENKFRLARLFLFVHITHSKRRTRQVHTVKKASIKARSCKSQSNSFNSTSHHIEQVSDLVMSGNLSWGWILQVGDNEIQMSLSLENPCLIGGGRVCTHSPSVYKPLLHNQDLSNQTWYTDISWALEGSYLYRIVMRSLGCLATTSQWFKKARFSHWCTSNTL